MLWYPALQGSPKQIQFMDASEDDWSWQQVLGREGKVGQAQGRLSLTITAAPSPCRSPPHSTGSILKHAGHPLWLCLALGTHKVSW